MKLIDLAKKYNYTCYWCKRKFLLHELSRDHINPVSKQTKDRSTNRNTEIYGKTILACKVCNNARGNLSFQHFKNLIK